MELQPINELLKQRNKLSKLLVSESPPPDNDPCIAEREAEIDRACRRSIADHIQEIDAEIAERTGNKHHS